VSFSSIPYYCRLHQQQLRTKGGVSAWLGTASKNVDDSVTVSVGGYPRAVDVYDFFFIYFTQVHTVRMYVDVNKNIFFVLISLK
jgi:hypothetical protein